MQYLLIMNHGSKTIFTFFFLVYFLFYAVSPLSAAVPSEEFPGVLEKQDNHTNLFIFDMVLWEILQKTKPSDHSKSAGKFIKKRALLSEKHFFAKIVEGVTAALIALPSPLAEVTADALTSTLFHLPHTYLEFSGLSPPLVS